MAQGNEGKWEKRWHPLREEWVVYSAHRNSRPWLGSTPVQQQPVPEFDATCYLCPGNSRISGEVNPGYTDVYIFQNDHPVVGMEAPQFDPVTDGVLRKEPARGQARVVCYDPRHNVTLAEMELHQVVSVFEAFRDQTREFKYDPAIRHVLIFENKGEVTGVSNPHPHCQIYATDFVFKYVAQQLRVAEAYRAEHDRNIYSEIIEREQLDNVRIIAQNTHAIAFMPFFSRYAYEIMIFPRAAHQSLLSLTDAEIHDLAAVFQEVIRRMDMNSGGSFPYVMSVMQAPVDGKEYPEFRMHIWLQPPYRQPGLIKYLAGPEIGGGNFMADTIPEEKAKELQSIDVQQYLRSS